MICKVGLERNGKSIKKNCASRVLNKFQLHSTPHTMISLQLTKFINPCVTLLTTRPLITSSITQASSSSSASSSSLPLKSSKSRSKPKPASNNIPSLEEFLFQQRVKRVYRAVLRQLYKHPEGDDLVRFIRDEFKINANERDLNHRKYLLSLGVSQIASMSASLGLKVDL